ncbi:MAG: hypothetical protein ACI9EF_003896 [Pseudohongiellaceae bacterium]|jgi:hypothetical protein
MSPEPNPSGTPTNLGDPATLAATFVTDAVLKRDLFGRIERGHVTRPDGSTLAVVKRNWRAGPWWTSPIASWLASREVTTLHAVRGLDSVPQLVFAGRGQLLRTWLDGAAMHEAQPTDPEWYSAARRLLVRLHRLGVTHNDLAKEPNWMVLADGSPGLIDFQLARVSPRRNGFFRMLAREDLRHLLKHKRTYAREHLTHRELEWLARPSLPARLLRDGMKPIYTFVTRRILGWRDREGQGPRP